MNIILGGTHGLGEKLASGLRARGEETFVVGRSYDESLHGAGMQTDLSKETDVSKVLAHIQGLEKSALQGFYWVSGYGYNGDLVDQPEPGKMAAVNFGNVMDIAQAAWQKLIEQSESTHFVVVSSTTGVKARKDEAVYAGTKHAQVGYTRSLGLEAERLGTQVRVALFLPGGMQTPFWDPSDRPAAYADFLDPQKVATRILDEVNQQQAPFYEETIERGSL